MRNRGGRKKEEGKRREEKGERWNVRVSKFAS